MKQATRNFLEAVRTLTVTKELTQAAGVELGLKRSRNMLEQTWYNRVLEAAQIEAANERNRREREAAEAAHKAKLAAEAERRGKLESFVERAKDMSEEDRALSWRLRYFLRDEETWVDARDKFTKSLSSHPTYALQWAGGLFEQAAAYEVALEVREWFEAGADWADMVEHFLKCALRGARNLGNSRSTSATSNLVDDAKTRAYATAYERLSGRSLY
ncbi:hypothetical protein Pan1_12 [Pseudanabaena phage Pan1]|nr:hypothetical protein Pan1_12 [Pseudanabaena phage Pan1]